MNSIFVRETTDFPIKVKALTTLDKNGDYNIYVHSDLSREAKTKALEHEKSHIKQYHLDGDMPACVCENKVIYK